MIVKNCKKHGLLTINEVLGKRCKLCRNEQAAIYRKQNPEKVALRNKSWAIRNKEKAYAASARYRETENGKLTLRIRRRRQCIELDDYYIKRLITRFYKFSKDDISQELIDLIRANIKLKRKLKLTKPIKDDIHV